MLGGDPFLASLRRHRLAAGLIVLQCALTTVVLALALAKAGEWRARITAPSGVDETRLIRLVIRGAADAQVLARERAALARLPEVQRVVTINQVPFGIDDWSAQFGLSPDGTRGRVSATVYFGDEALRAQLGVPLREGRDFLQREYTGTRLHAAHSVQVDATLARQLFHGEPAVGRTLHALGAPPLRVVGVYAPLQGPRADGRPTLILPAHLDLGQVGVYLLRLHGQTPPKADRVSEAIATPGARRWVSDYRSLAELREAYFRHDRWLATGLLLGMGLWLLCTGVGLANLADLLLQARVRQIGLCRALGARSAQIRWQLRRENLLLAGVGALAGLAWLHLLLRAWPWLGMQLETGGIALQALAAALVVLTGQCAMWPITREADAVPLAAGIRWA
ncbi:ABC transporter permease [Stenotrophomonas sp. HITSZ_GD]|uniref:ABC transporter permease n=1 Tax=Stenotrophomonas sp. HITSZ_GD TaxID=3037248 RepID=UPI00240D95E1|nr:FtsX-like permease family protein [Stenotrophomonas sp. HITSZ_GD]MDG2525237.1 ABC transporter permease [Stenotrophomonas sp. HITSZ_GD]